MLKTKNLQFSYNKDVKFVFPDIHCDPGDSFLILGKSGVGKTTLLHLLAGLISPTEGQISIDGHRLTDLGQSQKDRFRGKNIGIVFQKPHFISAISILQNLVMTQKLSGSSADSKESFKLLESLQIEHRAHAKPSKLSQGELQRASVARAVLNQPKVILADEPTSALDDESCDQVVKLLQKTAKELKAALVIVTHDSRLKDIIQNQIVLS